ncbi:DUF1127 domain-containing protein [Pseudomonas sp. RIT623]|uniref:DUF1127 domain-containing protein n=1 Tax=Pseudomonas sp. RIT623 TaxID=2559075 RepID=UPI00106FB528|nr:DUF1127 domain-containing protein [Pseudomonas sp. RIT623]TFF43306.1 DUF1127 domain-containing protein [Pseudomonas sp. RIT623]
MGSMSDVRVQLLAKELEAGQRTQVYDTRLGLMLHRWRTRKALLDLDARQLQDIGLSCEEAWKEGCKPFWKA